ncbi:MAG: glycosyl transferase, partial [Sphingobacteriaceae bacterium]
GMKPYAGSAWFSMSLATVKYILKYVEDHPEYIPFQRYCFSPDELFYLMILVNSPDSAITNKIQNNNKRLIKWKSNTSANPEILTTKDFEEIKNSDCLFARKFDPKIDSKILDLIDSELLSKT